MKTHQSNTPLETFFGKNVNEKPVATAEVDKGLGLAFFILPKWDKVRRNRQILKYKKFGQKQNWGKIT